LSVKLHTAHVCPEALLSLVCVEQGEGGDGFHERGSLTASQCLTVIGGY
jgi:hypothetical protein